MELRHSLKFEFALHWHHLFACAYEEKVGGKSMAGEHIQSLLACLLVVLVLKSFEKCVCVCVCVVVTTR